MKEINLKKLADSINEHFLSDCNKKCTVENGCNYISFDEKRFINGYDITAIQDYWNDGYFSCDRTNLTDFLVTMLTPYKDEFMVDEEAELREKACKNLKLIGFEKVKIHESLNNDNGGFDAQLHDLYCYFGKDDASVIASFGKFSYDCFTSTVYNLLLENYQLKQQLEAAQNE